MAEGNQQDHGSDSAATRSDDLDRESGPALTSSGRTVQACDRCRLKKVRLIHCESVEGLLKVHAVSKCCVTDTDLLFFRCGAMALYLRYKKSPEPHLPVGFTDDGTIL